MVEVAAEKNSTLVLPFPVEMLRFFEARREWSGDPADGDAAEPSRDRRGSPRPEPTGPSATPSGGSSSVERS